MDQQAAILRPQLPRLLFPLSVPSFQNMNLEWGEMDRNSKYEEGASEPTVWWLHQKVLFEVDMEGSSDDEDQEIASV